MSDWWLLILGLVGGLLCAGLLCALDAYLHPSDGEWRWRR